MILDPVTKAGFGGLGKFLPLRRKFCLEQLKRHCEKRVARQKKCIKLICIGVTECNAITEANI